MDNLKFIYTAYFSWTSKEAPWCFQQVGDMFNRLVALDAVPSVFTQAKVHHTQPDADANIVFVARWYHTNALPWCNLSQLKLDSS